MSDQTPQPPTNPLSPLHTQTQAPHLPQNHLFAAARQHPSIIDTLLGPHLSSPDFPTSLSLLIDSLTSKTRTGPNSLNPATPNRPPWFYASCLIYGTLLGRSYALISTPSTTDLSNPAAFPFPLLPMELRLLIYQFYEEDRAQRHRYWDIMTQVFIKAFWSREPEEGARYIAGVLMLTCGESLAASTRHLQGRGKGWVWWEGRLSRPDVRWGWEELRAEVMGTEKLPRGNTDVRVWGERVREARRRFELELEENHGEGGDSWNESGSGEEYVSRQVLEMFDVARAHLEGERRDWVPQELVEGFLEPLFQGNETVREVWVERGDDDYLRFNRAVVDGHTEERRGL